MEGTALEQKRLGELAVSEVDGEIDSARAQVELPCNPRIADAHSEAAYLISSVDQDCSDVGGGKICRPALCGCTIQHDMTARCGEKRLTCSATSRGERQGSIPTWCCLSSG